MTDNIIHVDFKKRNSASEENGVVITITWQTPRWLSRLLSRWAMVEE